MQRAFGGIVGQANAAFGYKPPKDAFSVSKCHARGWTMRSALLAACLLTLMIRPMMAAEPAATSTRVKADCVIQGTQILGHYEGELSAFVDKAGKPRRIVVLTMTRAGLETSLLDWSAGMQEDMTKFGASRLQAPHEVTLITVEDRAGDLISGYGNGDIGDGAGGQTFWVQVNCDITLTGQGTPGQQPAK